MMKNFKELVKKLLNDSGKAFSRFPVSILSAVIISLVAILKIYMEPIIDSSTNILFDSIQLSFLLAAVFTMAAVAYAETTDIKQKEAFLFANISGIIIALTSFVLLYFFGTIVGSDGIETLSIIATARVIALTIASAIAFVIIISKARKINNFSDAFFITNRAFITSTIYGIVIIVGVFGVLGSFEALIYNDLNYKVYQYLAVVVGFLVYLIFLGYFPSFKDDVENERIKDVVEQPRFIFVLLDYILVPIMLALTIVLLIWSARVMFSGINVSFNELSSITTSYVIIGIWLHIMVSKHETKLADLYKLAYPLSALFVLGFEAWALFVQVSKFGFRTVEYSFTMIWIFAMISIILMLIQKFKAYRKIALTAVVVSIVWIMPIIGYQDFTFNSQVNRLEKILIKEQLLVENKIVKTNKEIDKVSKNTITNVIDFIYYSEKKNKPVWYSDRLTDNTVFKDTFGFDKSYNYGDNFDEAISHSLSINSDLFDIKDYSYAIAITYQSEPLVVFEGQTKSYEISWTTQSQNNPKIRVKSANKLIVEKELESYLNSLMTSYPFDQNYNIEVPAKDMSLEIEAEDISILIIFSSVDFYQSSPQDKAEYFFNIQGIYIKEK